MLIIVGLGGNLESHVGSPQTTLEKSIKYLNNNDVKVLESSNFYRTSAMPYAEQPDFVNGAVKVETSLSAPKLLQLLHECEAHFGRERKDRWQARTLDMDLLLHGETISPSLAEWWSIVNDDDPSAFVAEPMLPHPRLHLRAFALRPLLDLVPDFVHPVLNQTGREIMEDLKAQDIQQISD